jgi:diketogulonate reductase-like aldo/keto reductase
MERSMRLMTADPIDLIQIHNLLDWRTHLATLRRLKDAGRVRYIGITHYQTSAFGDLESIMRSEEIDFVQLPMSITLPDAERRLLPLAAERRIAVLVNRPFEGGSLFRRGALPDVARELGIESWGELFLRWILAHEAVTCVIPATAKVEHLRENLRAGEERLLTREECDALRAAI